jgi:hypothetical protein
MTKQSAYAHRKRGRKAPQNRKRILTALEVIVILAIFGAFGYYFYQYTAGSDQFRVGKIQIEGLRVLNEDEVLEQSGLLEGGNVLYLDAEAICRAVEELPYVRECSLRQVFPDTVILEITERVGILTLQLNSRSYLIDEDGVALREFGAREVPLTPFITNVGGLEFVEIGDELEQAGLIATLEVWYEFSRLPMAAGVTVSEIAAFSETELVMYCDELVYEIRWVHEDVEGQALRLNVLWDGEGGALICDEYLDLRFGDDLVCK